MAWPPPRQFDPALFAPVPFDRRYSAEWWKVKEEEARAERERQERETSEREAKALKNYHGPRWWSAALISSQRGDERASKGPQPLPRFGLRIGPGLLVGTWA
jgi:hypothetical protein